MIAINTIGGGDLGFNALLYKPPTEQVMNYIDTHMQNAVSVLGNISSSFMDTTMKVYDKFNSSVAINAAKALVYGAGTHFNSEYIMPLTQEQLPTANYVMQQYIMANLTVSDMVKNNMCDGFQESYYDAEVGVVGTDRNDYRRAVDGLLQHDEDGYGYVEHYSSSDEVEDILAVETFAIQDTWNAIELAIANGIDPTSPEGDEL